MEVKLNTAVPEHGECFKETEELEVTITFENTNEKIFDNLSLEIYYPDSCRIKPNYHDAAYPFLLREWNYKGFDHKGDADGMQRLAWETSWWSSGSDNQFGGLDVKKLPRAWIDGMRDNMPTASGSVAIDWDTIPGRTFIEKIVLDTGYVSPTPASPTLDGSSRWVLTSAGASWFLISFFSKTKPYLRFKIRF